MKKILSTALAIVLFVGASQAQTTQDQGRDQLRQRKEAAMNNLNLTAEQKAKFKTIHEAQKKEMQELKNSGNVTPEQRKALHQKYREQFQSVLTPAQQEQMKNRQGKWKENGRKGQKGQAFGKNGSDLGKEGAFFKKELNLTADQETKLKGIFQEFRTKAQDIRANNNLTAEQKKAQFQSLSQQYMSQGKSVLTADQLKKFDSLQDKRKHRKPANV